MKLDLPILTTGCTVILEKTRSACDWVEVVTYATFLACACLNSWADSAVPYLGLCENAQGREQGQSCPQGKETIFTAPVPVRRTWMKK